MKLSRDKAGQYQNDKNLLDSDISKVLDNAKIIGANCISIGTPYDERFVPILSKWVSSIHAKGFKVWFRGNFSAYEGWFDVPKYSNIDQHHTDLSNFLYRNNSLFNDGDIFTPAPEPENGFPSAYENKKGFADFLLKSYQVCFDAITKMELSVKCGYFSSSLAAGQSLVLYENDTVIGGGIIEA
jgi:hypothetical protein